ncbi:MAG: DUF3822 family protein [Bacteroidales bacterium]|nr:DUF3822 family protein [Bacteroidales bacterium]
MDNIRLIDKSLNPLDTPFYHLSIQANLNGLSFSILDSKSLKYLALKQISFGSDMPEYKYSDHLIKTIGEDDLLQGDYKDVFCIWENSRTTLLPSALYNKNSLKTYFEFNQVLNDLDELHTNYLKQLDAYLIYPIHHEIANTFIKFYPRIKFFNQATPFIEYCLKGHNEPGKKVYANFQENFFDVVVFEGSSLLLHNSFMYRNEKDIIYFVLHVYDKLRLDTKETGIVLSGQVNKDSGTMETVKKYIKSVQLASPDDQFQYSLNFDKIQDHQFINLFNLYSCGS